MSTSAETLVEKGMVSTAEACKLLSVSRSHLYMLMNRGDIPWAKVGRSRRIPRAFLISFLAANLIGPSALPLK